MSMNVNSVDYYKGVFAATTGDAAAKAKIDAQYEGETLTADEELQLAQLDDQNKQAYVEKGKSEGAMIGGVACGVAGAAIGVKIGGTIGSFIPVPVVGTLIGALAGVLVGGLIGMFCGKAEHDNSATHQEIQQALEADEKATAQANLEKQAYLQEKYEKGKAEADKSLNEMLVGKEETEETTEEKATNFDNNIFNVDTTDETEVAEKPEEEVNSEEKSETV